MCYCYYNTLWHVVLCNCTIGTWWCRQRCRSWFLHPVCLSLGDVQIFDLGRRSLRPAATIEPGGVGQAATCLAFNCQNPNLLAVGKTDGTVGVWQLSGELMEQKPRESSQLEQIANQVVGWDTTLGQFKSASYLFFFLHAHMSKTVIKLWKWN